MYFEKRIAVGAGQANSIDPRATPAGVPDTLIWSPADTLPGTDTRPGRFLFALEGTAGQSISVQLWVKDETDPAAPKFYKYGEVLALTVGETVASKAVPGSVYVQFSSAPAAACQILIAPVAGDECECA